MKHYYCVTSQDSGGGEHEELSADHTHPLPRQAFHQGLGKEAGLRLSVLAHANQSAFIKAQCIQDSFRCLQASARLCILLKVDIARAWPFPLRVLQHLGFMQLDFDPSLHGQHSGNAQCLPM
jgi:hypothetical protein